MSNHDSPTKKCTTVGCVKPLRARGMCSTHYNQQMTDRHKPRTTPCAWCGTPVTGSGGGGRKYGSACSTACRGHLYALSARAERKASGTDIVHVPRTQRTDSRPRPTHATRARWFAGNCYTCGTTYVSETTSITCSASCAVSKASADRAEHKHRRRARERAAYVAPVDRRTIYDRDDWTCWLCHLPIDRDADAQSDMAPSLDHMIPLANGGTHEPGNTRTAHRLCNALRSNTPTLTVNGQRVAVLF